MKYDYACLMLDCEYTNEIHFDNNHIYDKEGYGIEKSPHVTLLYGIHDIYSDKDIFSKLLKWDKNLYLDKTSAQYILGIPRLLKLETLSFFENTEYDVLKWDVYKSANLMYINNLITENFVYTTNYPNYHPHLTCAYLKKGYVSKYQQNTSKIIKIKSISYSRPNNTKTIIPIEHFNKHTYYANIKL